jgi:hypothetical protein
VRLRTCAHQLSFGNQLLNTTSSAQTVTLKNTGALTLDISQVHVTGPFAELNTCGTSVLAGLSCTISVTFMPTVAGAASGTLTFTDSAADSPQSIPLSGTATAPSLALAVASGSSSSSTVAAGSSASYVLSIGGGGMSGTASLSCTGAPAESTCSVPATESVSSTSASNFNVSVTTTASSQAAVRSHGLRPSHWAWAFLFWGIVSVLRTKPQHSVLRLLWIVPLFAILLSSCGGGGSSKNIPPNSGTPTGTYTLTVTANLGSATQTQNLTLVVQ